MRLYNLVVAKAEVGPDGTAWQEQLDEDVHSTLGWIAHKALGAVGATEAVHGISPYASNDERDTGRVVLRRDHGRRPTLVGRVAVTYPLVWPAGADIGTPVLSKPTVYAQAAVVTDWEAEALPDPRFPKKKCSLVAGTVVIIDDWQGYNTEAATVERLRATVTPPGAPEGLLLFSYYDAMADTIASIAAAALNPELNPRNQG